MGITASNSRSWTASPIALALLSYAFFLVACLIPPSVYSHYMSEPDLMFLDPATLTFYTLCVAGFAAGVKLIEFIFPSTYIIRSSKSIIPPWLFIGVPLTLAVGVSALSAYLFLKQNPEAILLIFSSQGAELKDALSMDSSINFTYAPFFLIGITWWAFWRYSEIELRSWEKKIIGTLIALATLCIAASSLLTLMRSLLMLGLGGLVILYMVRKETKNELGTRFLLKIGVGSVVGTLAFFFASAFLRGTSSWDDQINGIIGYTVASYNRMAAVLDGRLHYPYAGHYIYLSTIVAHSHALLVSKIMNPPDNIDVWGSEFGAVANAGLDARLIWSGAFGYIFSDLGWFSPAFLFGYGILYGFAWNAIRNSNVFGVILYPYAGFCVLIWLGSNYLLDVPLEFISAAAIFLAIYESVFLKPAKSFHSL